MAIAIKARQSRAGRHPTRSVDGRRRSVRLLVRDASGAAIVEFGIVAMPFFLLLMAIFQTGLIFFEQEMFQTAVSDAGRLIYTGQANSAGYTQAAFKQQVCNRLPALISCANVAIDVRPYSSFASAGRFSPVNAKGVYDPTLVTYNSGSAQTIVVVTGYALQPVLFPMMSPFVSNAGSGSILLTASAAFRNEPWTS